MDRHTPETSQMQSWQQAARTLKEAQAVEVPHDALPVSRNDWQKLEALCNAVPYQQVIEGDAGDKHSVWVGRFVNDHERPTLLHPSAEDVLQILDKPELREFYSAVLGENAYCIRRCQVNVIREGGFVGLHVDQDANRDYLAALILHFPGRYSGGDYLVHPRHGESKSYKPQPHSMLISSGAVPHEVTKVTAGERKTLVYFLSTNFGPTVSKRKEITTMMN